MFLCNNINITISKWSTALLHHKWPPIAPQPAFGANISPFYILVRKFSLCATTLSSRDMLHLYNLQAVFLKFRTAVNSQILHLNAFFQPGQPTKQNAAQIKSCSTINEWTIKRHADKLPQFRLKAANRHVISFRPLSQRGGGVLLSPVSAKVVGLQLQKLKSSKSPKYEII